MARTWQRPLYHVMYATPLYVFIIVVVTSFVVGLRSLLVIIALGCLVALMVFIIIIVERRQMGDIWYSPRTFIMARATELLGPLERALQDGHLEPKTRKGLYPRWTTIDLKGGVNLTLGDIGKRSVIYVGPDLGETRRDVEAVKGVVDAVLDAREARAPTSA